MNPNEFSDQLFRQVESAKKYGRIIATAWDDESFKRRLLAEPKTVLKDYKIEFPEDLVILVVENTENLLYLTLPAQPSVELSNEQLDILQQYSDQIPQQTDFDRAYYQIVAKAWEDASFKERLLSEPKTVLAEYGVELSEQLEVQVVENTPDLLYLTIPVEPSRELCDEELELVAGGDCLGTAGTFGTIGGCFGTAGTFGCSSAEVQ